MHKVKVVKEAGDMLRFVLRDCNAMLFIRDPWSDMEHFTMALIRGFYIQSFLLFSFNRKCSDHLIEKYGNMVFYEVERPSTCTFRHALYLV